jgi:hypothetical protein
MPLVECDLGNREKAIDERVIDRLSYRLAFANPIARVIVLDGSNLPTRIQEPNVVTRKNISRQPMERMRGSQ